MIALLPIILTFLLAVGVPPVLLSRKRIEVRWWDYALPFWATPLWVILEVLGVGATASLSNLVVEGFYVLLVSALSPWIRLGLLLGSSRWQQRAYRIIYLLPIVFTVILRVLMPTLPE